MTDHTPILPTPGGANWDAGQYLQVPPHKLVPNPDNPRKRFDLASLQAMASTMTESGVAQPLVVRQLPADLVPDTIHDRATGQLLAPSDRPVYQIVAGERRWRSATIAQLASVPIIVRRLTDHQVHVLMTVENLQREDLSPVEEAEGLRQLMATTGATADAVGKSIGRSKAYVYQILKLLDLCPEARESLNAGQVDKGVASYLGRLPDHKLQLRALRDVAGNDQSAPLRYRPALAIIQQNYLLRIDRAPFDTTVSTGWDGDAPACTTCPHRTGHTADLFAEKDGPDMCLQPDCYRAKAATDQANRLKRAKDEGLHVITGREAKALMPAAWTGRVDGHLRLDDAADSPSKKPLRDIVAAEMRDTGTKETLIENPDKPGELIAVLPVATAQELLDRVAAKAQAKKDRADAEAMSAKARDEAQRTDDKAREADERKAKEAFECGWRREAVRQVWALSQSSVAKPLGPDALKAVSTILLHTLNSAERTELFRLLDIGKVAPMDTMKDRIAESANATPLLLVMLAAKGIVWESWHEGGVHVNDHLLTAMNETGVNLPTVQKLITQRLAEKAEQSKPRQQPESAAAAPTASPANPIASSKGGRGNPKSQVDKRPGKTAPPPRDLITAAQASTGIAAAMQSLESQSALPPDAAPLDAPAAPADQHATTTSADETTSPGAASLALSAGMLVRVRPGSKGPTGHLRKCCGRVGVLQGKQGEQWFVRFGPQRYELFALAAAELEAYTADPIIGDQVRVLKVGQADSRQPHLWRTGTVVACQDDGWLIRFAPTQSGADALESVFGTDELGDAA